MPNPNLNRRVVQRYEPQPPLVLHTADLWLRGDQLITLNGSTVSEWNDLTANGNDATQTTEASQPTYDSAAINGRAGLVYDGSSDFMVADSVASAASGTTKPFAVISAVQQTSLGVSSTLWSFGNSEGSVPNIRLRTTGADVFRIEFRNDAGTIQTGNGGTVTTDAAILSTEYDGSNIRVYLNQAKIIDTGGPGGATTLDLFSLGVHRRGGASDSDYFLGHQSEHVVQGTPSQRTVIEQYMMQRYGI